MKEHPQLLNRLIEQLDSLIAFMGLSHEEVFDLLQKERIPWFGDSAESLPAAYATYRQQVVHSALLLGYSYFESFLTDLLAMILLSRPDMLPKDRKLPYSDVLASGSRAEIVDQMIKREILDLLYKSMGDIVAELRDRYGFTISEEEKRELCRASFLRNCIVHNSARADSRLAEFDGFEENQGFELTSGEVHALGITLRALVRRMSGEANTNHSIGIEQ
jgi:hypothetical protein